MFLSVLPPKKRRNVRCFFVEVDALDDLFWGRGGCRVYFSVKVPLGSAPSFFATEPTIFVFFGVFCIGPHIFVIFGVFRAIFGATEPTVFVIFGVFRAIFGAPEPTFFVIVGVLRATCS